ncbi:WD40 repeat-like protein [Fomitiporia mediterranea MF3/22]|uniref:WD40 repeat-like protein n=1 Tax=Fomitiporia mediterranea (strain MF3/22) TaxID=694068 RepID=UPI0004408DED|nr:WD40 repeat-like protein [Fomitiporia mediterranea MF3/22]EJC98714.1 WD40 repeat-like protein [Fomitiporia mediterranea MF3/22]
MQNSRIPHEGAYEADDGDEAFQGMDAYVGDEGNGETMYGIQITRDEDDDDEDYTDEDEDEGVGLDIDDLIEEIEEAGDLAAGEDDEESAAMQGLEDSQDPATRFDSLVQRILSAQADTENDTSSTNTLGRVLAFLRSGSTRLTVVPNARSRTTTEEVSDDDFTRTTGQANTAYNRRNWVQSWWKKPHTEPQPAGVALLMGGEFGRIGRKMHNLPDGSRNFSRILRERSMRIQPMPKQDLTEYMVPNSAGAEVSAYQANVYSGQYSADSSFYYVCCKDFNLHVYDTTAMPSKEAHNDRRHGHRTRMKVHKSIKGIPEGWTIPDSHLSSDNERLIYSSMSPTVYMVKTLEYDSTQVAINFADAGRRSYGWGYGDDTCIWSCRFSADGNEVIAGGGGKIFVYDLLADRRTVKISAHFDDVNSCCWADQGSNVLVSASDDTFIKVWDRRSLGSSTRPSGVLIGHTEGITNVSAKGDGRYVISNGKDQALRLWDLRKMTPNSEYNKVKDTHYGLEGFDYRYVENDRPQRRPAHPKDCSIMTYRGHSVLRTLIRCHFSPAETTGGRYIYSGSFDGRIHVWSLDGRVVQILDRSETLPLSFDYSGPELPPKHSGSPCVRDVTWHSREPVMLSAAWGSHGTSSVARHEWKGLTKMNHNLEDWVEKMSSEGRERHRNGVPLRRSQRFARMSGRLPGSLYDDDDDEYDEDYHDYDYY